jgi:transcription antitermination factor NusG
VPDNLVHGIQRTVEKINEAGGEELFHLQPGDQVTIEDGPFTGYCGVFDTRLSGTERVRVLLSMLQQSREIPVELSVGQITKE